MASYTLFLRKQYGHELCRIHSIIVKSCFGKRGRHTTRLDSLQTEASVIRVLQKSLGYHAIQTSPSQHSWYDFSYKKGRRHLFFNIKVSKGGCIDAFNKSACIYSLTTIPLAEIPLHGMSLNTMVHLMKKFPRTTRDRSKEYYYIFIDKRNGDCFIKSMCDIQNWVPTTHNLLQIHWDKEKNSKCVVNRAVRTYTLRRKLISLLQSSVQKYLDSCSSLVQGLAAPSIRRC
jgi:hypothetical protein